MDHADLQTEDALMCGDCEALKKTRDLTVPGHAEASATKCPRCGTAPFLVHCCHVCGTVWNLSASAPRPEREERLAAVLRGLVKVNEEWNASVQAILGRPPSWNDSYLAEARKALEEKP